MSVKIGRAVAGALVVGLIAAACGGTAAVPTSSAVVTSAPTTTIAPKPSFAPGSTMAKIVSRGKLIVASSFDQPLIRYKDPITGTVSGFEIDLIQEIAAGLFGDPSLDRVEIKDIPFANRIPMATEGTVDMAIGGITVTKSRMQQVDFSSPYLIAGTGVLVPSNSPIKALDDIKDKTVAAAKASTQEQIMKATYPNAKLTLFDSAALGFEAVKAGRADALIAGEGPLISFVSQSADFRVLPGRLSYDPSAAVIKKGTQDLLDFVNKVVKDWKTSGRWAKSWEKYLGPVLKTAAPQPPPDAPDLDKLLP
jgi:putative glutamine transport system substrate-binding protein